MILIPIGPITAVVVLMNETEFMTQMYPGTVRLQLKSYAYSNIWPDNVDFTA